MKFFTHFLLVATVCTLVVCDESDSNESWSVDSSEFENYVAQCNANPKTKIDVGIRERASKGLHIEYTPQVGAHTLCLSQKIGLINDKGEIETSNMRSTFEEVLKDEHKVDKYVTDCSQKKATPEETSYNIFRCLSEVVQEAKKRAEE